MADELNLNTEREQFGKWLALAQAAFDNDATQTTPEPDMFGAWLAARRAAPSAEAQPTNCTYPNCACVGGGTFKPCARPAEASAPPKSREKFLEHLAATSKIVAGWPEWKRSMWGEASAQAEKRWLFVETPEAFAERFAAAITTFGGDVLAAVRHVLIENPPALAAAASSAQAEELPPLPAYGPSRDMLYSADQMQDYARAAAADRASRAAEAQGEDAAEFMTTLEGAAKEASDEWIAGFVRQHFGVPQAEAQGEGLTDAVKRAIFAIHDDQLISRDIIIHAITKAIAAHLRAAGQPKPIIESSDKPYITGGKCAFCGSVAGHGGDGERLDRLDRWREREAKRGFHWSSMHFDMDKPVRGQLDEALDKAEAKAKAKGEKGGAA